MCCRRKIVGISWREHDTSNVVEATVLWACGTWNAGQPALTALEDIMVPRANDTKEN